MATLVLNVLVGARERWVSLSLKEKQKLVAHMRTIANGIEIAIGQEESP